MKDGECRIPSGCAIAALIHKDKHRENGERITQAMQMMHERSNGLGGGFAAYGIYPEHKNEYALHLFYDTLQCKDACEAYLSHHWNILHEEEIPTKPHSQIKDAPLIWRYFIESVEHDENKMTETMFYVNTSITGAYIFSCGKNMGVFKGVGYPEDLAEFYCLNQYQAYTWIAHGRYPTNTPGWWAGAHPFGMLDFALVHNGEISSYDANRRYIEMFDYPCSLLTDTEVITYELDFLMRKHQLSFVECADILAAPFWDEIDQMRPDKKRYYTMLRRNLGSMLINGPFSIILGFQDGVGAMNDRLKLRSLMIGEQASCVYMASEESAIRKMSPQLNRLFSLKAQEAYVVTYEEDAK